MTPNLTTGRGVRVHQQTDGLHVVAEPDSASFIGWFKPSLSGRRVTIGAGYIDGIAPTINGVPLDGGAKKLTVPSYVLTSDPNEELRSWVAVKITMDLKTQKLDPKSPTAAVIADFNDREKYFSNGFSRDDGNGSGYFIIGMIVWSDIKTPRSIVRDAYFNQRHQFRPGVKSGKGWHFFSPTA